MSKHKNRRDFNYDCKSHEDDMLEIPFYLPGYSYNLVLALALFNACICPKF